MLPLDLSLSPMLRYWMPPAQCGLRACATPVTDATSTPAATSAMRRFTIASSAPAPSSRTARALGQPVPVHLEAERGAEKFRRLARGQHARHEDLEVFHDLGDRGVDGQLERDLLLRLVHVEEAL